ncbi:hypothetical protein B2I21_08665 [Chryseobacterium mucoviscidosis]|nr:hypothetical protein B2I21_08665 [Chryseobacterium mucoviscidosis]
MNPFEGYRLTSPFGWRIHPVYNTKKFHKGVDLVVSPSNGPLYAFVGGEVLHAKMGVTGSGFGNYGNTVAIRDDKGYLHVYAHMSSVSVSVGQHVKQGDKIGNQGSTGISTGPHLHYEIRKKTSPSFGFTVDESGVVEPTQYLINYYGQQPTVDKGEEPMTAEEKKRVEELEATSKAQAEWIKAEKAKANMPCPDWAKTAYEHYKDYIADETGSYEFWRLLVIEYRKEKGIKVTKEAGK